MPEAELTLDDIQEDEDVEREVKKTTKKTSAKKDNPIEVIIPQIDPKTWVLSLEDGDEIEEREFVQKPLTYFDKIKYFGMVGQTLDAILAVDSGITLNTLLSGSSTQFDANNPMASLAGQDMDSFIGLLIRMAGFAPDFLKKSYLIWLGVPMNEREWADQALDSIDDEMGVQILETFVDQNWEAVEDFFTKYARRVWARVQKARGQDSDKDSSKPSKPTRRTTRRRSKNS
jgi:hypothetical protein